jgi:hypothetical protein
LIIAQFEGDMMEHLSPASSTPDHSAAVTARRAAGRQLARVVWRALSRRTSRTCYRSISTDKSYVTLLLTASGRGPITT